MKNTRVRKFVSSFTRRQISAKLADRGHRHCFSQWAFPWILSMSFLISVCYKHTLRLNFNGILKCFSVQ